MIHSNQIITSVLYVGFRTELDQFNNYVFKLKVDDHSLACYSLTAALTTSIATHILNQSTGIFTPETFFWNYTYSSENMTKSPPALLGLSLVFGTLLVTRTLGNIVGKRLTEVLTPKSITSRQIEQLNVSTVGIGISTLVATATCLTHLFLGFQMKYLIERIYNQ